MLISPDEVITGSLVNAIALMGRRISVAVVGMRKAEDLTIARWFETFRLTESVPDQPELSMASRDQLAAILKGDEIQAALQELLAARLTDAPETDASRARKVICLTLTIADPDAARFAEALATYYDDQICGLVARLEGKDPPLLAQIRSDAFSTRMINILHAIERHSAALTSRPDYRTEASFLTSYRHHVIDQHGKLEPPDFERRRRVPIESIYVPTIVTADRQPEPTAESSLNVFTLAGMIDRSVLLGDPGGGKTTAANVLMHHFASAATARVPFLVTLRDFAAQHPLERSVVGHIEHTLETLYQCPSPPGLVDLLLLTGRAVVIFDGLDELLDTSRRADVTTRVEHFCAEYPLVPVLVTSRLVGYDQARLDEGQFTCYRLGGFGNEQVAEYAHKWFAQDPEAREGDVDAFLTDSDSVPDLRSNPLLLALLCILYRGAGSIPRSRAEVYEQCSTLLFRKWDARRRIHQDLRAGHLLEPALRHLAWWLFTKDNAQPVTERELIAATTNFLHGRGFESEDDAREAAREFVEFCRGRMWVFSDAGTTATGEKLYAFTHRTFMEYFAGAQLAYDCDTPELLANSLAPHVARDEWWVVAEIAIQLKDRTSNGGAQRIYAAMLIDLARRPINDRNKELQFLAQCLRSVDPSPQRVRELVREIITHAFAERTDTSIISLIVNCGAYHDLVADEIDTIAADMLLLNDQSTLAERTKFIVSLKIIIIFAPFKGMSPGTPWWTSRIDRLIQEHAVVVILAAQNDDYVRNVALGMKLLDCGHALEMRNGLTALFQDDTSFFLNYSRFPYLNGVNRCFRKGWSAFAVSDMIADLEAVGEYLCNHPELPWIDGRIGRFDQKHFSEETDVASAIEPMPFGPIAYLGAAAILSILVENGQRPILREDSMQLGPLEKLLPYLERRYGVDTDTELPELPVPDEFKQVFRDWTNSRVNFVRDAGDEDSRD